MEDNEMMNIKEVNRLLEWLKAHGHTAEESAECLRYIEGTEKPQA